MSRDYLPSRQEALLVWAQGFRDLVVATPEAYGLTIPQAEGLGTLVSAYGAALQAAVDGPTRGPVSVSEKDEARDAMVAEIRTLVKVCQAWPEITDPKREALKITVPDPNRTPVPPPEVAPQLDVAGVQGRTVNLRLREASTGKRRKPDGVYSATILRFVGEDIPQDMDQWVLVGSDTRLDTAVTFGDQYAPGTKVWFTAFWLNRRAESGPACTPVSTHLGFGVAASGGGEQEAGGEELQLAA